MRLTPLTRDRRCETINRTRAAARRAVQWPMLAALAAGAISGCTVGADYHAPRPDAPTAWSELETPLPSTRPTGIPSVATGRPVQIAEWWATFNDPMLDTLIAEAVKSNYDLKIAAARVREARAQRGVVAGTLYPQINADGNYTRARISENGIPIPSAIPSRPADLTVRSAPGRAPGGNSGSGTTSGFGFGPEVNLFQLGFDASWELDVFGGTRRAVEAARADIGARIEDQRDTFVTLLSEVARNYLELRGAQRQLAIARDTLASQQRTLAVTRERRQAGLTTEVDVSRATSLVAGTAAQIPSLAAQIRQSMHRLAVLLGRPPGELGPLASQLELLGQHVPAAPAEVPVGLPSDLLRRRPDIRRAERELAAATARTAAATSDLFPRFTLTGGTGLQSLHLTDLFNSGSIFYSIGPGVSWPIFDAGRIRSNIKVQSERQAQALLRYEKTVLVAFADVEDALSAYSAEQVRRQSLADAAEADRQSVIAARDQYQQGVGDFLTVLDAERSLFRSEDLLAQSERLVSTDLVALYKAMGGGWEPAAIAAPVAHGRPRQPILHTLSKRHIDARSVRPCEHAQHPPIRVLRTGIGTPVRKDRFAREIIALPRR